MKPADARYGCGSEAEQVFTTASLKASRAVLMLTKSRRLRPHRVVTTQQEKTR